jgi:uncharacterized protein
VDAVIIHAATGFIIGALVGLTGVGGGSLLTPLLVLIFGVGPATAIGTDLLFAALTKAFGTWIHARNRNVDWRLVGELAVGSVPTALLTVLCLKLIAVHGVDLSRIVSPMLGFALLLTALALLVKDHIVAYRVRLATRRVVSPRPAIVPSTTAFGAVLGIVVSLSSVGAGALGVTALMLLRPALPIHRIIGSDIAHAVPLTLVGGLGYASLGAVDWSLLGTLLLGSVPGIWFGSQFARRLPERVLRIMLASLLLTISVRLVK